MRNETKTQPTPSALKKMHLAGPALTGRKDTPADYVILLVDDDPSLLKLVSTLLGRQFGYTTRMAHNAEKALPILRAGGVDLVITDYHMNGLNGIDLLRWIKKTIPATSVILMTGDPDPDICEEALGNGAAGYLSKPFSMTSLHDLIEKCREKSVGADNGVLDTKIPHELSDIFLLRGHYILEGLVSIGAMMKVITKRLAYSKDTGWLSALADSAQSKLLSLTGVAEDFLSLACSLNEDDAVRNHTVDLEKDIVNPVWQEFDTEIRKKNINVVNIAGNNEDRQLKVDGNPVLLKSVFRNLFYKSIKNCQAKERFVSCDIQKDGDRYQIQIFNSCGAPRLDDSEAGEEYLPNCDATDNEAINDIGLLLARKIIKEHGGKMWSVPHGDGNSFFFTLPACQHNNLIRQQSAWQQFEKMVNIASGNPVISH